jgi:hypothetical protein
MATHDARLRERWGCPGRRALWPIQVRNADALLYTDGRDTSVGETRALEGGGRRRARERVRCVVKLVSRVRIEPKVSRKVTLTGEVKTED